MSGTFVRQLTYDIQYVPREAYEDRRPPFFP